MRNIQKYRVKRQRMYFFTSKIGRNLTEVTPKDEKLNIDILYCVVTRSFIHNHGGNEYNSAFITRNIEKYRVKRDEFILL